MMRYDSVSETVFVRLVVNFSIMNSYFFLLVQHGLSALMKASRVGHVEVTRLLVAGRAILDLKSKVRVIAVQPFLNFSPPSSQLSCNKLALFLITSMHTECDQKLECVPSRVQYVAILGRNQTLFHCIFRLHYHFQSGFNSGWCPRLHIELVWNHSTIAIVHSMA